MSAIDIILEERKSNGPFKSLFDFASRLDLRKVNRKAFESLIRAGAFDQIHPNRASLLASVKCYVQPTVLLISVGKSVHWKATGRILGKFYHKIQSKNLEIMYPPMNYS